MRDEHIDQLLTSLKIINSIKEGQKVCVRNGFLALEVKSSGIQASMRRWVYGDNRYTTMRYIRNVINNAINTARLHEDPDVVADLKVYLTEVIPGLKSLEVTYSDDIAIVSALQVLENRITSDVKKMERSIDKNERPDERVPTKPVPIPRHTM